MTSVLSHHQTHTPTLITRGNCRTVAHTTASKALSPKKDPEVRPPSTFPQDRTEGAWLHQHED